MMVRNSFLIIFLLINISFYSNDLFSQGQNKIIQLSGVVVGEDSISGVGGVHIYVPAAGRGTTSNPYGYFELNLSSGTYNLR